MRRQNHTAVAKRVGIVAVTSLVLSLVPVGAASAVELPSIRVAFAAPVVAESHRVAAAGTRVKTFWSAILRVFITISRHATVRMAERSISQATLKRVLNDGKVIARRNGVTHVRSGNVTVLVNSKSGTVITVIKAGGRSGGGGV